MELTSFGIRSITCKVKPRSLQKYPVLMRPNILSIEAFEGRVQLKTVSCLLSRDGISFRPPPG